ncbi:DUF2513 domain-containing protein [bacterium]|nr:DUF2513 domain-containing protein [bacterium]
MKLDIDLVRKILLTIEEAHEPIESNDAIKFENLDAEVIDYHLKKVLYANLITSRMQTKKDVSPFMLIEIELTWEGHQLIDLIREESFWNKLKTKVISSGVGISIYALKIAAPKLIESMISKL